MNTLVKEFQEISDEISTFKGLVDDHLQALNDFYEKLSSVGIEPDKTKVMNYMETVIGSFERKLMYRRKRINEEIGRIESLISEYQNLEVVLKDDLERALEELNANKEELEAIRASLDHLEEELNAIRRKYQE